MKKNNKSAHKSQIEFSDKKKILNPQNGKYFFYPNEYKDAQCRIRIPGRARQILDVIERFTLGFNIKKAKITFKTFRKRTGLDDRNIMKEIKKLIAMYIITVQKDSNNDVYYGIQMDYTRWKPLSKKTVNKLINKKTTVQKDSNNDVSHGKKSNYKKQKLLSKKTVRPVKRPTVQKDSKATVQKDSDSLSKKTVPSIKDTYLNTHIIKDRKNNEIITTLEIKKEELKEDLKNFKKQNPGQTNKTLIEGIKKIDYQIENLINKNKVSQKNTERGV